MVMGESAARSLVSQHGVHVGFTFHLLFFTGNFFFLSVPLETVTSAVGRREAEAELAEGQPSNAQCHLHSKLGLWKVCNTV